MSLRVDELADVSACVAGTSSITEKVALLAGVLRRLEPGEIEIAVSFLSGRLRQGRIGIGGAALGRLASLDSPGSEVPAHGTAGAAGAGIQSSFDDTLFGPAVPAGSGAPLTLAEADATLTRIAALDGRGSASRRSRELRGLFLRASPAERDFLARVLSGEMRQGALGGIVEQAIAEAYGIPLDRIQRASMLSGDLGAVARAALTGGADAVAGFHLEVFRPVAPMLATPADTIAEALERFGAASFEYKLDGARIQVHKAGDDVRVYSRLLNDVTAAVPEVVEAVRAFSARECVVDGEAYALTPGGRPQPFQTTMRRFGRRLDVAALRAELPIAVAVFDLLRLDGRDRIDEPQRDRVAALRDIAAPWCVPSLVTTDLAEAERFYDAALEHGHEGFMAKRLEAPYLAGRRGAAWLKIKPAHTLDLVVLAAEWGHGRRSGWLSNLHLAALDPATGGFVMLGKTFKGMTDDMLRWQTTRLGGLETHREGHIVHVRPELVVEVAFSDVQESPIYPGGMALRFARIKRYREDKAAADADTVETVRAILKGHTQKRRR